MRVCMCVCMWVNRIVSKRCIRLSSNLLCILLVNVGRIQLILVNLALILFFNGVQKRILIHYNVWSQIIKSMLAYVQHFRLSSNSKCALEITVPSTTLILAWVGCIVFFTGYTKFDTLRPIGLKYLFHFSMVKLLEPVQN